MEAEKMPETTLEGKRIFCLSLPAVIKGYAEGLAETFNGRIIQSKGRTWRVTVGTLVANFSFAVDVVHDSTIVVRIKINPLPKNSKIEIKGEYLFRIRSPDGAILWSQPIGTFRTCKIPPISFTKPSADEAARKSWLFGGDLYIEAQVILKVDAWEPAFLGYIPEASMDLLVELGKASYSDFALVSADGQEIKTYKLLLNVCSPVFRRMLATDCPETKDGRCHIRDFDTEAIRAMLSGLRCPDLLNNRELGLIEEVFQLADKYQMLKLKVRCGTVLAQKMDMDNVMDMLSLADRCSDDYLKKKAFFLMEENTDQVVLHELGCKLKESNPELYEELLDHYSIRKGVPRKRPADDSILQPGGESAGKKMQKK